MRGRGGIILCVLALVALFLASCDLEGGQAAGTPTVSPAATATFPARVSLEKSTCQFRSQVGAIEGSDVTCFRLNVPEDRSNPNSQLIHIAVAVFKTGDSPAAPSPLIFLQGGPGGRLIQDLAPFLTRQTVSLLFGRRDVILVDQRGTGYSAPSLACPEVDALQYQTDASQPPDQQAQAQNNALKACYDRLTGQGINLSAYTTLADANDIHDLIGALGYQSVDLYGVSYGTRLVLEILRAFPQGIRSAVLDSTVPAQTKLLTSIPSSTARVFNTLFQGCAKNASCNAKYPTLESVFYQLYASLNTHPATFQVTDKSLEDDSSNYGKTFTVSFSGDDLVNLTFSTFYLTEFISRLPKMIYEVKQGNYTTATDLYSQLIFSTAVNWGLYFSVECAEDITLVTPDQVNQAAQAYPTAIRQNQAAGLLGEIEGCKLWKVKTVDASESQPVTSSIPTLVLEGEYDPVTPPANGDLAAQTLSKSYTFLFPGTGHGVWLSDIDSNDPNSFSTSCTLRIPKAFWDTPTTRPDGSCVAQVGEPQFQ